MLVKIKSTWIYSCHHIGLRNLCKTVVVSLMLSMVQCACNALMAICWARVCKLSYWRVCDLDYVLGIGDDLYKTLGLHWYLEAIICNFYAYYFVNSNNIYARELAVSNRSSVLLKFLIIQQVESYIQVAHLKFQLRQRQYFQSQFTNVEYMILNMLLWTLIRTFVGCKKTSFLEGTGSFSMLLSIWNTERQSTFFWK